MNITTAEVRVRELPMRGWRPENHAKLVRFLATYAGTGALAMFDADNTVWSGDLGDTTLVHLVRNVALSERVPEVLPEVLDVPATGFGTSAGRLFPAARIREAVGAMKSAYARVCGPTDLAPSPRREPLPGFSETLVASAGPLRGDGRFMNAYRVYAGTMLATYHLLEGSIGCVAPDPLDRDGERDLTASFPEDARPFFEGAVRFPPLHDTGPRQAELRRAGRLGSYTQIAIWEGLDKTPEELRAVALAAWAATPVETAFEAVFPVDVANAGEPVPLDFGVDAERFVGGGGPAAGVTLGVASMLEGAHARPEMIDLFAAMIERGIVPVVITASQVDLVRAVLDQHYGFAGGHVVGMEAELEAARYGADLRAPATYRWGKVDAMRSVAKLIARDANLLPAFCAGDTVTDLEMLAYSGGYRLFFDRAKPPFMRLAERLLADGLAERTIVQAPL